MEAPFLLVVLIQQMALRAQVTMASKALAIKQVLYLSLIMRLEMIPNLLSIMTAALISQATSPLMARLVSTSNLTTLLTSTLKVNTQVQHWMLKNV